MLRNPHYVIRTRIGTSSFPSKTLPTLDAVKVSHTFPSRKAAVRDAESWNSTGDWIALVIVGPAPR